MTYANFRVFRTFMLVVLVVSGAFAQTSTTGAIEGRVTETSAPIPGVTIEIQSPALQGTRVEVTDTQGAFRFPLLPPGTYDVSATLSGYKTVRQPNVIVGLGRTVKLDVVMSPATVSEEITVTAEAPVVDTQSTTTGANVTKEMINTLPMARDFYAVAMVAPGTTEDATGTMMYGSTGAENQYIIDGLNVTGVELGIEAKTLNFDFIEEVEVITAGAQAEYGRITGGIINAITKSGGNEFRGDVFGYYAGGGLKSDLATHQKVPKTLPSLVDVDTQYDLGFDVGGYLMKDRLWFFGAYNRVNQTNTVEVIRDLNAPGAPGIGSVIDQDVESDLYAAKLTLRMTENHTLNLSVFGDPSLSEGPQFVIAGPESTWRGTNDTGGADVVLRYSGIFGTSWVVNALGGVHHEEAFIGGPGKTIPQLIDQTQVPTRLSGGFGFHQDQEFDRDVLKADISRFMGNHQIKFGGDYEDISSVNANWNGGAGQRIYKLRGRPGRPDLIYYRHRFFVDDTAPGFDRDNPATWQLSVPLVSEPETHNTSFYLQDSWRVTSNFTLNAGVRWETQDVIGRTGESAFEIDDNWAPRVGFVWDVMNNGRSKLFANYGRFYESIPMDINIRAFGGEVQCFCYNTSADPSNIIPDDSVRPRSLFGGEEPVDPDLKGQYTDEVVVGYQYEVAPNLAIGIQGTYRDLGRVIEDFLFPDGNYFIANPGEGIGRNLTFYDYSEAPAPDVKREFIGIELNARKRFGNNWQFFASYLWSELKGNYDGLFQASTGQLDPNINSAFDFGDFMVNAEGPLTNDREHQFKFNGSYTLPVGLTAGLSAHWYSGVPLTAFGYSFVYNNWEYFLTPRGSLGRGPADYEADLHLGYPVNIGSAQINLLVDVFNIFDRQAEIALDQRYNLISDGDCAGIPDGLCNHDGGLQNVAGTLNPVGQLADPRATATNPDFLRAGALFTPPRSIRLGVRVSF